MPAAAARGRRPAPANRSRQQVQREKALQVAARESHTVASNGLHPGQQVDKPPANETLGPSTAHLAVKETAEPKPSDLIEQPPPPPAEEASPGVQELEKEEVELLVWLGCAVASVASLLGIFKTTTTYLKIVQMLRLKAFLFFTHF